MSVITLTKNERKKLLVIITCILLAILAWLFMALNSTYVYTAKTVMIYKNFPQNRAFHPLQSDTINLKVEGTGWQLIFTRLRIKPQYININLKKLNTVNYILISDQLSAVNSQLESSQKVISANPDTLYFDFSKQFEKKIPIKLVSVINFKSQYGLTRAIELKPGYITVRGPQDVLSGLKEWKTDTLKLNEVENSSAFRISLQKNNLKNVNIFPANVEVKLSVEEFTEKTIELPLKIYNNNEFNNVSLYPKKVSVTFLVALSDYKQTDEDFIEAGVDLNDWKVKKHSQLTVNLVRFPDYCKLVKITPSIIDFIVEK